MSHRKWGAGLLVACALVPVLAAPAEAQKKKTSRDVTVMTRNVYVGADLIPLATTPNPQAFETAAGGVYQVVLANDFAKRAKLLAAEVKKHKPDLIGVQEAARWLRGPKDGAATQASDAIYDSETELLKAFKAAGVEYRTVKARNWFDYEGPTAEFDARIIQRDLILVRKGSKVKTGKTFSGGFRDTFDPPTPIGVARQLRGWVGVDAKIGGRGFRFVTTHLEAYDPKIGDKQMEQLLANPLKSKKTTSILLGDFNSAPPGSNANDRGAQREANAYSRAIRAGFYNALPKRNTCCFAEDLRQTGTPLKSWIDHIVTRPKATVVRSAIVGSKTSERGSGLWPSDHAGIVAKLRLK
jgi:endonuclease/exonuclease/phosphatase family metal-dependent hydrolase